MDIYVVSSENPTVEHVRRIFGQFCLLWKVYESEGPVRAHNPFAGAKEEE